MLLLLEFCSPLFASEAFLLGLRCEVLTISAFLNDTELFAFLCETLDEFFHALAFARLCFIVASHCYPFANFDQIAGFIPKAERSTPGSFGSTPSKAFEPWGAADLPDALLDNGFVPSNKSTPL